MLRNTLYDKSLTSDVTHRHLAYIFLKKTSLIGLEVLLFYNYITSLQYINNIMVNICKNIFKVNFSYLYSALPLSMDITIV